MEDLGGIGILPAPGLGVTAWGSAGKTKSKEEKTPGFAQSITVLTAAFSLLGNGDPLPYGRDSPGLRDLLPVVTRSHFSCL